MIPLVKPLFPNLRAIEKHLAPAWKERQFSNFGPVFKKVTQALSSVMNGHALPVTSGTTAIQVALTALGMRGKRVALPDYTHSGTLLAIIQAGAIPVLFAVEESTWTLSIDELRANTSKYDAVIVVSPFGYFVNTDHWEAFSKETQKPIVYDFAGAFGFFPTTKNMRCYSFHSTKNFGVGEGGCVVTPTQELWETCRRITNFETLPDRNVASIDGINGKVDELKCASILSMLEDDQLQKVWNRILNKRALLRFYGDSLRGSHVPIGPKKPSLCVLGELPAEEIERQGTNAGIVCKRYYPLLTRMPGLESAVEVVSESSDDMLNCVALPSDVTVGEAYRVVDFVKSVLKGFK